MRRYCKGWNKHRVSGGGGIGRDAIEIRPRKPEDPRPPAVGMGCFGIAVYEHLAIPVVQSHVQNWSVDYTGGLVLPTVYGRRVISGTPFETLAGSLESRYLREAFERAGRPGMPVQTASTSPTEFGVFGGGGGVPGGIAREQMLTPVLFPSELKIDYHTLQKATCCHIYHASFKSGTWSMIGGYAGGIEGAALAAVATAILQAIVQLGKSVTRL